MNQTQRAITQAIVWGGLVAGTVDIFAASTIFTANPLLICRAIASGLLGKPAFSGGLSVVALGVLLQWGMSMLIAAIFVMAWRRLAWMRQDWRVTGALYGVPVFLVMTYMVRPLSAAWPPADYSKPFNWINAGENLLAMVLFGLIIAYVTARFLRSTDGGQVRA